MRKIVMAAFASLILLSACKKDKDPAQPKLQNNLFPMSVGNEWKYKTHTDVVEGGDSSSYTRYENWVVTKDTVINGALSSMISKIDSSVTSGHISSRNDYYKSTSSGTYGVATNSAGRTSIFLRIANPELHAKLLTNDFGSCRLFNNGLYFPNPLLYLLKTPLNLHAPWNSNEGGPDMGVTREYISTETITVPAGTFQCTKLRVNNPTSSGNLSIIEQYFAENKGLIKETRTIFNNHPVTPIHLTISSELVSTNL